MITKEIFDTCKGVVKNADVNLLLLDVFGEVKIYVVNFVVLKTRENRYHEVRDAQDVTSIIHTIDRFATGLTNMKFMEKIQSIPMESFKFGTDDYIWMTKVTESTR